MSTLNTNEDQYVRNFTFPFHLLQYLHKLLAKPKYYLQKSKYLFVKHDSYLCPEVSDKKHIQNWSQVFSLQLLNQCLITYSYLVN